MNSEQKRDKWQDTPSANPRYRGATPADVGRALLRKPARKKQRTEKATNGRAGVE